MSGAADNRDGLSPPPRNIFSESEEDDDIFEPSTESGTDMDGIDEDEEDEDDEFLG